MRTDSRPRRELAQFLRRKSGVNADHAVMHGQRMPPGKGQNKTIAINQLSITGGSRADRFRFRHVLPYVGGQLSRSRLSNLLVLDQNKGDLYERWSDRTGRNTGDRG